GRFARPPLRARRRAARRALLPGRGAGHVPARLHPDRGAAAVAAVGRARGRDADDGPGAHAPRAALRPEAGLAPRVAPRDARLRRLRDAGPDRAVREPADRARARHGRHAAGARPRGRGRRNEPGSRGEGAGEPGDERVGDGRRYRLTPRASRRFTAGSGFASVTLSSTGRPSRCTVTATSDPASARDTAWRRSSPSATASPASFTTTSPAFSPAFAAGPSASTAVTSTPVLP